MSNKNKKHRLTETCYMCDKPKSTREHVPPLCFFPEQANEAKARDFRINLITVPSCDDHNLQKSSDDEYVRNVIALHWRNNSIGYEMSMTKVLRSFVGNKPLLNLFIGEGKHKHLILDGQEGVTTLLDRARFDSEMGKIVRGIYFNQFRQKCRTAVDIYSRSLVELVSTSMQKQAWNGVSQASDNMRQWLLLEPKHGENPDVFYYQFLQTTKPSLSALSSGIIVPASLTTTIMRLVFYGGFEVIATIRNELT